MSIPFILAFILMGFTLTIAQVVIIRDLLVVFAGNELSIAIILANWLWSGAMGSLLGGIKRKGSDWPASAYALLQLLISILLPVTIYAIRDLRHMMGLITGEGASLIQIFFWTLIILSPLGIAGGISFSWGCNLQAAWTKKGPAASIGTVYFCEAVGAGAGGVLYTFFSFPVSPLSRSPFFLGCWSIWFRPFSWLPQPSLSKGAQGKTEF